VAKIVPVQGRSGLGTLALIRVCSVNGVLSSLGIDICGMGIGHGEVVMLGRLFRIPASYGSVACSLEDFGSFRRSGLCPVSPLLSSTRVLEHYNY
jgi:hypothetical protein